MLRNLKYVPHLTATSVLATSLFPRDPTNTTTGPQIPERGHEWGYLNVNNHCTEPLNLWSIGVWHLGGVRDPEQGFGTPEEQVKHVLAPGGTHREAFRTTCPNPKGWKMESGQATSLNSTEYSVMGDQDPSTPMKLYCTLEDKLAGQGVAIKIARGDVPEKGKILQLEYALVKDPNRGDKTHRINYDVSLLDCGAEAPPGVSDFNATSEMHKEKLGACPGYGAGLSLTFDNDTATENCPPTFCDGETKCLMAYLWDRTRKGESSLSCEKEYWGNMTLDLCVGKNQDAFANAKAEGEQWMATAGNLPSCVKRPDGSEPIPVSSAAQTTAKTFTSASQTTLAGSAGESAPPGSPAEPTPPPPVSQTTPAIIASDSSTLHNRRETVLQEPSTLTTVLK